MKNMAASVRQRLLNISREQKRSFMEVVQHYGLERFLYRLSKSVHADRFILKGAMLLKVWDVPDARPTMDVDLLGVTSNDANRIADQMKEVLGTVVEDDGLVFDIDSVTTQDITQQSEYVGLRVLFKAKLDKVVLNMQVDMGFGDAVFPKPSTRDFPVILDFPSPKLLCYHPETSIAEKFHAMVQHDMLNSRMKDFYDIWYLSHHMEFDGKVLFKAIQSTFDKREVKLQENLVAFSEEFISSKQLQWNAFRKKMAIETIPSQFGDVVDGVKGFLVPLIPCLLGRQPYTKRWNRQEWL